MKEFPFETWLVLRSGLCDPALNMALDEVLLETAPQTAKPALRFYGWTEPAATFGYSQKIAALELATPLRPLVRRTTGGGLVPHDRDWTYSLAIPPSHGWHDLPAAESYQRMHRWIQTAFERLGVTTTLAPSSRKELPGQCFVGHEKSDLLWHGRKIAGAAQRRSKTGLLIQGSVQPPSASLRREDWEAAMREAATQAWNIRWEDLALSADLLAHAQALAQARYAGATWNRRR